MNNGSPTGPRGPFLRIRNRHRSAAVSFANWCVQVGRLVANPFIGVAVANEDADPRRRRRALTEAEIDRLIDVARQRPLWEAQTVRRGPRVGQKIRSVRPEVRARLEAVGRTRAMAYRMLVLTGLRKGELAALVVDDLHLDAAVPHVALSAGITKNAEEDVIPLRADLVAELRSWIAERFGPGTPPPTGRLFDIPTQFIRNFDRDLKAAGIPKRDERGPDGRCPRLTDDLRYDVEQGRCAATRGHAADAA